MGAGFGPPWRIDGPLPVPQPYGLLKAAEAPAAGVEIIPDVDERGIERWGNGAELYAYIPDVPTVFNACSHGSDLQSKPFGVALPHPQFDPMVLVVPETCLVMRVPSQQEFKQRALRVFEAVESFGIAWELLSGTSLPENPYLADGNGVFPLADAPTSPQNALAVLEEQIALTGRLGLIHCSPMVATTLRQHFSLDTKTGVMRTVNGNVVIADYGYARRVNPHGHLGADVAQGGKREWMFATGPIDIRRTETFVLPENVAEALDRGTGATAGLPDNLTYRVERYYLVTWDTELQAAALVDRCQETC